MLFIILTLAYPSASPIVHVNRSRIDSLTPTANKQCLVALSGIEIPVKESCDFILKRLQRE